VAGFLPHEANTLAAPPSKSPAWERRVELTAVRRERDLFDYYIDHYSTKSKSASESQRGASIEQILRRTFPGKEFVKAKRYLAYDESEKLFTDIRERILSD
jgi:hypothetical protein